ncbi:MAG TPA: alpha/beta hydrolase-fold protein [Minicystis sp.]|nr:alpha/beta hydrolase-fold protein [Minicystis sp.]
MVGSRGAGRGSVAVHRITSRVLAGNPLGDPTERDLHVYLPPGHDAGKPTPALLALVGFTGTGGMLFNIDPLGETLADRLDRLIESGRLPPAIVAAPDCFNRFGGSQYVNSTAIGRYEDYLLDEVMPFVESVAKVSAWAVFGKSSGGYGSMVVGMRHPDRFRALACHSGDANFELCYLQDVPRALDAYRTAGGPAAWLEAFWADENRHRKNHHAPLDFLAMAAHYSPNPASPHLGIDFPFDLETGVFRHDVWERWRAWDPVNMIDRHVDALKKMALVYVDCGTKDEFFLHWGARAMAAKLAAAGVRVVHQEFDDGHMSISYRYDASLPLLVKAIA